MRRKKHAQENMICMIFFVLYVLRGGIQWRMQRFSKLENAKIITSQCGQSLMKLVGQNFKLVEIERFACGRNTQAIYVT